MQNFGQWASEWRRPLPPPSLRRGQNCPTHRPNTLRFDEDGSISDAISATERESKQEHNMIISESSVTY